MMSRRLFVPLLFLIVFAVTCKHDPLLLGYTKSPICDPDTVYFVNDITPFLNTNCAYAGCHGNGSAEEGVDLGSYDQVIATIGIDRANPAGSELYDVMIDLNPDKVMPPPGENIIITQDQLDMVLIWIEQGARNNECVDTMPCDTMAMSYANDVAPILSTRCGGQSCHGSSGADGGFGLMMYTDVQTQAASGALTGTIFHEVGWNPMPDGQSMMDSCTINTILAWVNQGAQDN